MEEREKERRKRKGRREEIEGRREKNELAQYSLHTSYFAGSNIPVMMKHDDIVGTEGIFGTEGTGISIM